MYCVAILSSGNYAANLFRILERKGYIFELVSTPCQISKGGCSYCIKFPVEYKELLIEEGRLSEMYIREIYKIIPMFSKNKYERIY